MDLNGSIKINFLGFMIFSVFCSHVLDLFDASGIRMTEGNLIEFNQGRIICFDVNNMVLKAIIFLSLSVIYMVY